MRRLMADALALLDARQNGQEMPAPADARMMTVEELLTTSGTGWEETCFRGEEGEADEIVMEKCAWVNGRLILDSGGNADLHDERVTKGYNRAGGGSRIWRGTPTDEQRAEEKWDG